MARRLRRTRRLHERVLDRRTDLRREPVMIESRIESPTADHAPTPPSSADGGARPGAAVEVPAPLYDAVQAAWRRWPDERPALGAALTECVRWLRARGSPPEQTVRAVKQLLPVHEPAQDRRMELLVARAALLDLALDVYFDDGRGAVRPPRWPDVEVPAFATRAPQGGWRAVRDADGEEWRAYERPGGRHEPGARPSLVFEREGFMRRCYHYPPNWRELPESALRALLEAPGE